MISPTIIIDDHSELNYFDSSLEEDQIVLQGYVDKFGERIRHRHGFSED